MSSPDEAKMLSTFLFCRSTGDGTIAPDWDDTRETELRGCFEVGLTIAERYLLEKKLGKGAMGRVFLAKDLRLDRPVAMKVVSHRRTTTSPVDLEAALAREARLGANLNHKGIAAVYDFGFQDDKSYTVFEFVEGETLRTLMERRGRIPLDETLQVVTDLAAALDFAHVIAISSPRTSAIRNWASSRSWISASLKISTRIASAARTRARPRTPRRSRPPATRPTASPINTRWG
jgi:hypothetical protein